MRARWLFCLLATTVRAQEGDGAPGKGEDPVALLVKQLADPEAAARTKAARALGRTADDRAVAAARDALYDTDEGVRAAAAVALVRLDAADDAAIVVLAAALKNPDWYTRWDACVALGSLGPGAAAAAPALLAAAADPALDLSREAATALGRVAPKDPQVLAAMVRLLESDRDLDRKAVLRMLDAAGQIALAADWLAKEMVTDRHGLRGRAATLLGRCGVGGVEYLEECLRSADPTVRARAIFGLADAEKVGPAIFVETLSDPFPEMRRAAINALVRRKAVEAAPRIAALLSDPEASLRLRAAVALDELKVAVPEAGPGLVRLAAEGHIEFASAAHKAMCTTGFAELAASLEFGPEPSKVPGETVWAVRLKPRGGTEDLAARLRGLVASIEDNKHGAALVTALKETLAEDEDAILVTALAEDDAELRRTAAILLGHLARDREAGARALEKALRDKDLAVRVAAASAIARLRSAPR